MKIVSFHTTFFIAILLSASHGGVRVSSKPRSSRTAAYRKRATRQGDEEFIQKNVHVGHGRDVYEKSPQGNSFEDGYFRSDSTFNNWEHGDRYGGDGISYNKKYETRSGRKSFSKEAVHVLKYTESLLSKVLVAIASAIGTLLLSSFILSMTTSSSHLYFSLAFAILGALSTSMNGDFGEFSRALGVFIILMMSRAKVSAFLPKFVSQLKAACFLAERRPYPPCENPWKFIPEENDLDVTFSMTKALLAVVLCSAYVGWLIARPIPLFPNWIGAIGAAVTVGGATNVRDSRGDILRFFGHSINRCVFTLMEAADDVYLREKTLIIISRLLFFLKGVDNKYHILDRAKILIAAVLNYITRMVASFRNDMSDGQDGTRNDDPFGDLATSIPDAFGQPPKAERQNHPSYQNKRFNGNQQNEPDNSMGTHGRHYY